MGKQVGPQRIAHQLVGARIRVRIGDGHPEDARIFRQWRKVNNCGNP
jgi:hypothetical protein